MVTQKLIRIRELRPGDLRAVLEIEYRCFPDPYPLSLLDQLHRSYPSGFIVAELNGEVIGYAIGAMRWGGVGHVLAIAVDPPYRRRGIGSMLMMDLLDRLRANGAKKIRLEVRKSNLGAQQFYRSLGFHKEGEIPYYYEDGETAVLMGYELSRLD